VKKHKPWLDNVLIQIGIKQGEALSPLLFNFDLEFAFGRFRKTKWH
jgi:hypothetical protein